MQGLRVLKRGAGGGGSRGGVKGRVVVSLAVMDLANPDVTVLVPV